MNVRDQMMMDAESRRETARLALVKRNADLEAAIRTITHVSAGAVCNSYRDGIDLTLYAPILRDVHSQDSTK